MNPRAAAIFVIVALAAVPAVGDAPGVHPESWPRLESAVKKDPKVEERAEAILAKMTLEDKVGQVLQPDIRRVSPEEITRYNIGSVLNGGGGFPNDDKHASVQDWLALADAAYDASMDTTDGGVGIPIFWGVDAVHGHNNVIGATVFPHNIGLGAANNPDLMRRIGEVTAKEMRVTGHDWNFSPTVAVPRDDRWGRTYEGYSEDPEIVAAYAPMMVLGLQGTPGDDDFLGPHRVISTVKHFLGDGGTEGGVDQGDNLASEKELREIHGAGYAPALEAGVQSVMASFNSWHGDKMHGHKGLLTDVLKGRMGFDGLVVGDWNGHGQLPGCTSSSCAAALNAGVDMYMVPDDWKELYENTLEQARSGEIPAERLDSAVRRILRVKIRAGLFEAGRPSSRALAGDASALGTPEHRAVARQAVRESLVLLKNNGGVLPLARGQRVLVAGDGADDIGKQTGGWTLTWQGTGNAKSDFPDATSIWDGIQQVVEAAGGTAVLFPDGSFDAAQKPDVAIVVFGEDPYAEGVGDRPTVDYQPAGKTDLELLRRLKEADIKVVSVFLTGRPLWVNPEINASDVFVVAWLPGSEGNGVAEVLFRNNDGSVNHDFEGRLSFSWPKTAAQAAVNRGDADYDPLFAYGYGLTYAEGAELAVLPEDRGIVEAPPGPSVYFDGGPVAPWRLFLGSPANWRIEATTSRTTTQGFEDLVVENVDRRVQEDARSARWAGAGPAYFALSARPGIDISSQSKEGFALAFDVRVDEPPTAAVNLSMSCGMPCRGSVDLMETLAGLPSGEWQTLRVPLSCLAAAGADMTRIDSPFGLATTGKLALAFSGVRLVARDDGPTVCPQ